MTTGRGTMVERSPGVWRLRAYLGRDARQRPIQVSRTFRGGRRAAQEELARFVTEVADKGAPVTSGITVGELLDKWIDFVTPQREPGTIRGYTSHAQRAKASLGHLKLTKLSAQHLDRAYAAWLAQGLSPTTVHHVHTVLSAALRQAVRWDVIPRAVTDRAEPCCRQVWMTTLRQVCVGTVSASSVTIVTQGDERAGAWRARRAESGRHSQAGG